MIPAWLSGAFTRFVLAGTTALGFWTEPLDGPGFVVVHPGADAPDDRHGFTVAPRHESGMGPRCGKPREGVPQRRNRERIWDRPIGCRSVEGTVRVRPFAGESCGTCFTSPIDGWADGAHATERALRRVAELIPNADVAHAARFFAIPEKNRERWYYDHLERQPALAKTWTPIRRIGIDALSFKSGTGSSSP